MITNMNDCTIDAPELNLWVHVAGSGVMMLSSFFGVYGSILLTRNLKSDTILSLVFILKMLGIGVLVATCWIYFLPYAFYYFARPCLTGHWKSYGTCYVGLCAVTAGYIIQLLDIILLDSDYVSSELNTQCSTDDNESRSLLAMDIPICSAITEMVHEPNEENRVNTYTVGVGTSIFMFNLGLIMGSLPDIVFFRLLFAGSILQFFVSVVMGSMLGSTKISTVSKFYFSLPSLIVSPIGIIIGTIVNRSLYSNMVHSIVMKGILYSISAGVGMYISYCSLLGVEINHSKYFQSFKSFMKVICFIALYLGSIMMTIVWLFYLSNGFNQ